MVKALDGCGPAKGANLKRISLNLTAYLDKRFTFENFGSILAFVLLSIFRIKVRIMSFPIKNTKPSELITNFCYIIAGLSGSIYVRS